MSYTKLEALCNPKKRLCIFQEKLKKEFEKLVASGGIFNWRDDFGLNALTHAAMGHCKDGPCVEAFNYLFTQQVQPYSPKERADGLEVIGSTFIFMGRYETGLHYWSEALECRGTPKSGLLKVDIPPVTRRFAEPQWTDRQDVDDMLEEIGSLDGQFNAVYQALLVRLEFGLVFRMSEYFQVFQNLLSCPKQEDDTLNHAKLTVMLFEWYESYVSPSISAHDPSVYSWLDAITTSVLIETSRFQDPKNGKLRFESVKIVLKVLAVTFEKLRLDHNVKGTDRIDFDYRYVDTDCVTLSIISLLRLLCQMPLDDAQSLELKRCVNRIIETDWRDYLGNDLLLSTCKFLVPPDDLDDNDSNVVRMLVEAGAHVNSVNFHGDTCLHLLVGTAGEFKNPSIAQFLLDNGARPNMANKEEITPLEALRKSISNGTVSYSLHYLQCVEQQSRVL